MRKCLAMASKLGPMGTPVRDDSGRVYWVAPERVARAIADGCKLVKRVPLGWWLNEISVPLSIAVDLVCGTPRWRDEMALFEGFARRSIDAGPISDPQLMRLVEHRGSTHDAEDLFRRADQFRRNTERSPDWLAAERIWDGQTWHYSVKLVPFAVWAAECVSGLLGRMPADLRDAIATHKLARTRVVPADDGPVGVAATIESETVQKRVATPQRAVEVFVVRRGSVERSEVTQVVTDQDEDLFVDVTVKPPKVLRAGKATKGSVGNIVWALREFLAVASDGSTITAGDALRRAAQAGRVKIGDSQDAKRRARQRLGKLLDVFAESDGRIKPNATVTAVFPLN